VLKAQGIQAQLDAAGTGIEFVSANGAFSVAANGTGTKAPKAVLDTSAASVPVYSAGLQNVALS